MAGKARPIGIEYASTAPTGVLSSGRSDSPTTAAATAAAAAAATVVALPFPNASSNFPTNCPLVVRPRRGTEQALFADAVATRRSAEGTARVAWRAVEVEANISCFPARKPIPYATFVNAGWGGGGGEDGRGGGGGGLRERAFVCVCVCVC